MDMKEKRLTYKQSIDGYEDVGLCEGVTIDEAICKLADYEDMWSELRVKIEYDLQYHQSGFMQSMDESVNGEIKCRKFLRYMKEIENKYI